MTDQSIDWLVHQMNEYFQSQKNGKKTENKHGWYIEDFIDIYSFFLSI